MFRFVEGEIKATKRKFSAFHSFWNGLDPFLIGVVVRMTIIMMSLQTELSDANFYENRITTELDHLIFAEERMIVIAAVKILLRTQAMRCW